MDQMYAFLWPGHGIGRRGIDHVHGSWGPEDEIEIEFVGDGANVSADKAGVELTNNGTVIGVLSVY